MAKSAPRPDDKLAQEKLNDLTFFFLLRSIHMFRKDSFLSICAHQMRLARPTASYIDFAADLAAVIILIIIDMAQIVCVKFSVLFLGVSHLSVESNVRLLSQPPPPPPFEELTMIVSVQSELAMF
ncbi:hypothetical protein Pst134EB_024742 [Puccinia striiformis f. sp. tritici]|nr:hypothetical protein Pst134EB_024742 [Puccinia striiformis f. sp. tritici]